MVVIDGYPATSFDAKDRAWVKDNIKDGTNNLIKTAKTAQAATTSTGIINTELKYDDINIISALTIKPATPPVPYIVIPFVSNPATTKTWSFKIVVAPTMGAANAVDLVIEYTYMER